MLGLLAFKSRLEEMDIYAKRQQNIPEQVQMPEKTFSISTNFVVVTVYGAY